MPTTFTIYAEAITSSLCCFAVSQGIGNEGTLGSDNREAWLSAISHDVTEFGISRKILEGTESHQMNVKMKWKWIIVAGQTLTFLLFPLQYFPLQHFSHCPIFVSLFFSWHFFWIHCFLTSCVFFFFFKAGKGVRLEALLWLYTLNNNLLDHCYI